MVCSNLDYLGIRLDEERNKIRSADVREISSKNSPVKVLVVPTNEELEIVKQCYQLLVTEIAIA
jgi:acetate kinase